MVTVVLDGRNKKRAAKPSKRKPISRSHLKKLKVHDIKGTLDKCYEHFISLHSLWLHYFREAIGIGKIDVTSVNANQLFPKITKADYHGCIMTVTKSKCPSYVGTTGILLQETRNAMLFITEANTLKTIPKANTVFTFEVDGIVFTIYGNHFKLKPSERAVKKFKTKSTLEL